MTAINDPVIVAEVRSAFERYETALLANDNTTILDLFIDDPSTVRYGVADHQYGYAEIAAFRASQQPFDRELERLAITTYGSDFAVAQTLFHRDDLPGQVGRQTQVWIRTADGWKVGAAHVSMIGALA